MVSLSEEQALFQDTAKAFALDRLAPNSSRWDEECHFPVDVMREGAGLGFAGIYVREDVGGAELSRLDAAIIFEQLAYGDIPVAAYLSIHNMASWMIDQFGSDTLRKQYLPKLTDMSFVASYCLTEPSSGSDAVAMKTSARREGDQYVISGSKQFISGAGVSDVYVLMAKTSDDGARGVSAFVIPKESDGLSFGNSEKKMGWNAQPTRQVNLDEVRVSASNRIGEEGDGFKLAMAGLDGGRLNIAACSLGGGQRAFDIALVYSKDREQFGQPLSKFQSVQFKLADMETKLQSARLMLYEAARRLDEKSPVATRWCAMAKKHVTDTGFEVANEALQILGGYGYLKEYGIEQIVRDLRVHQILEGTNEIMRVIISRDLLK